VTELLLPADLVAKLDRLVLQAGSAVRGTKAGQRRGRGAGHSIEFKDHRSYVAGDDLRFLDWNLYGRLDRLFLKLFHEEEDLDLHLVVDTSASMNYGQPEKLPLALQIAAAVGYVGLASSARVRVHTLSADTSAPPLQGKASAPRLLERLSLLEEGGATSLLAGASAVRRAAQRPGVVVLLSDLLDRGGIEEPFRRLGAGRHDVHVVQILAPQELEPELSGHLVLVDCEDGERVEVSASRALLDAYRARLRSFLDTIATAAGRSGFSWMLVRSDADVEQVVLEEMRRRGYLR
jgi:uncharacterized protein (DUF58 family)